MTSISCELHNADMMKTPNTIAEIRLTNLRLLIEESKEGTAIALAKKCKTSASYLSQILIRYQMESGKAREVGTTLARKLEKGTKKPEGWMDVRHDAVDKDENELRLLYAAMDINMKAALLGQARIISKIGK